MALDHVVQTPREYLLPLSPGLLSTDFSLEIPLLKLGSKEHRGQRTVLNHLAIKKKQIQVLNEGRRKVLIPVLSTGHHLVAN